MAVHRVERPHGSAKIALMKFSDYLDNIPNLHYWGAGWNTGGFKREHFTRLHSIFSELPQHPNIVETGAGNSTIFFLLHSPARLISVDPGKDIYQRIHAFCETSGIDTSPLEIYAEESEWVLPAIASANKQSVDFALIDGDHGWPTAMVDFCYMLAMLKPGGMLMVDDIDIYSLTELSRLLGMQPGFSLVSDLGKARIFRKEFDGTKMPSHREQPYLRKWRPQRIKKWIREFMEP
jgi:hypothetical protein